MLKGVKRIMKSIKIITFFGVFLIVNGCAHRGEDPVSTYYGNAKYHCYYYSTKTGRSFEGIDVEQNIADVFAKGMCEAASPKTCVLNDCIQK